MSNALTVRNDMSVMDLGNVFVKSGFFSDSKEASQAVVKILAGQELGFAPIASMTGVYIVKGKVSLSANLMAAAIKRSGKYNYRIEEHTDKTCTIRFIESGEAVGVSTFTIAEAQQAGLTTNQTWKNFPKNMLFARALSNGAKWFCPDIFGGPIYTPDELGAEVDEDGVVIDVPATPTIIEGDYDETPRPPTPPAPPAPKREPEPSDYDPATDTRKLFPGAGWDSLRNWMLATYDEIKDGAHAGNTMLKAAMIGGHIASEEWALLAKTTLTVADGYMLVTAYKHGEYISEETAAEPSGEVASQDPLFPPTHRAESDAAKK